jgi:antitoxin (DNA-binding transcriptional repressor) of toxin-antitoxin stability system
MTNATTTILVIERSGKISASIVARPRRRRCPRPLTKTGRQGRDEALDGMADGKVGA